MTFLTYGKEVSASAADQTLVQRFNEVTTRLSRSTPAKTKDIQEAYLLALEILRLLSDEACVQLSKVLIAAAEPMETKRQQYLLSLSPRLLCTELTTTCFDQELRVVGEMESASAEYASVLRATIKWSAIAIIPFILFLALRSLNSDSNNFGENPDAETLTTSPPPAVANRDPDQVESTIASPSPSQIVAGNSEDAHMKRSADAWYLDAHSKPYKTITRLGILGLVAVCGAWGAFLNYHLAVGLRRAAIVNPPVIKVPMMGALFGLVIFFLFASRLVQGRIFPTSEHNEWQVMMYVPEALFCLCLWCLIGGFSQDRIARILTNMAKEFEKRVKGEMTSDH